MFFYDNEDDDSDDVDDDVNAEDNADADAILNKFCKILFLIFKCIKF